MSARQALQRRGLQVARRIVPWRLRARLAKRARAVVHRYTSPLVTVVVTTQDSAGWVRRCLRSITRQRHRRLQIVVVDAASTDDTLAMVRERAASDQRIQVVSLGDRGVGAARNAGAALAKGRFLLFVDAADVLPRTAIASLVASLRRSGSDLAVGRPRKSAGGKLTDTHWAPPVHLHDRRGITVDAFPDVMRNLLLGSRMFRTSFWQRAGLSFPADVPQSAATLASAYVDAGKIDVLRAVTLHWAPSEGDGLLGSKVLREDEAAAFATDLLSATEHVDARGTSAERAAWTARVLDIELEPRIRACVDAEPAAREAVRRVAATVLAAADDAVLADVRVAAKLLVWAAAEGRWADVEALVEHVSLYGLKPATVVDAGEVLADRDVLPPLSDVPRRVLRLSDAETRLDGAVQRLRWSGPELEVTGWAFVRGIDLTGVEPELELHLVDPLTGDRHRVEARGEQTATATRWGGDPAQRYDASGFVARIRPADLSLLGANPWRERAWRLEATVRVLGVERSGVLRTLIQVGSAARPRAGEVDGVLVAPVQSPTDGLTLRVARPRVRAVGLTVEGTTLVARLHAEDVTVDRVRLWVGRFGRRIEAPVTRSADGGHEVRIELPPSSATVRNRVWQLSAISRDGNRHRVVWGLGETPDRTVGRPGRGAWCGAGPLVDPSRSSRGSPSSRSSTSSTAGPTSAWCSAPPAQPPLRPRRSSDRG